MDLDNIRAVVEWANDNDTSTAVKIATALQRFWSINGSFGEGYAWLERVISNASSENECEKLLLVNALIAASQLVKWIDLDKAYALLTQSLTLSKALQDKANTGMCLVLIGELGVSTDARQHAREYVEQGLNLLRRTENKIYLAYALSVISQNLFFSGQYTAAEEYVIEFSHLGREAGALWFVALAKVYLATIALHKGDYDRAEELFLSYLRSAEEARDETQVSVCLCHLGDIVKQLGRIEDSKAYYDTVVRRRRHTGDISTVGWAIMFLGTIARQNNEIIKAESLYRDALIIAEKINHVLQTGWGYFCLGLIAIEKSLLSDARQHLKYAVQIAGELKESAIFISCLYAMSVLTKKENNIEQSVYILGIADKSYTAACDSIPGYWLDDARYVKDHYDLIDNKDLFNHKYRAGYAIADKDWDEISHHVFN
jgi:tetratricopeptide (TPR) repeat protein